VAAKKPTNSSSSHRHRHTPSEPAANAASAEPTSPVTPRPQPTLAIIDADIYSGKDELAREQLFNNLARYHTHGVAPLWVNWLRHRADLRFVCMVRDFEEFNDFMLDVVRSVEGMRETSIILSFGGRADLDMLLDLEMEVGPGRPLVAGNVLIDVRPGHDRECFQALLDLPPHPDVRRVWLLNCYHSDNADLMLLLLAKNEPALNGYVMSWVRTAPGVVDTELENVQDWRWLAAPDDIIALCEMFFVHNKVSAEKRDQIAR
jgi:hypothetical protein